MTAVLMVGGAWLLADLVFLGLLVRRAHLRERAEAKRRHLVSWGVRS